MFRYEHEAGEHPVHSWMPRDDWGEQRIYKRQRQGLDLADL